MNNANFLAKGNFPQSTYTFDFLQNMIKMAGSLALLGGDNFILTGCADGGNGVISEGLIVINGQLYPFAGGAKKIKIKIQETKESDHYAGVDYPEAYIHRKVIFADDGDILWDDMKQVLTNKDLNDKIQSLKSEEPGFVKMWAGSIDRIPDDYMLCNGDIVTTAQYPRLAKSFKKENEESFSLPDLRQKFIAGFDVAEPDYNVIGKIGGKDKVQLTIEEMPNHSHTIKFVDEKWGDNANSRPFPNPAGTAGYAAETTSVGGGKSHENRPPFYVLAYVIKVK